MEESRARNGARFVAGLLAVVVLVVGSAGPVQSVGVGGPASASSQAEGATSIATDGHASNTGGTCAGESTDATVTENYTIRQTPDSPGEIVLTVEWCLPETVTLFRASLPPNTTVSDTSGFEPWRGRTYEWTENTRHPSITFSMSVPTDRLNSSGVESVDTGEWALVVPDVDTVDASDGDDLTYRANVSVDGPGVADGGIAYLGAHDVTAVNASGQTIRVVVPAATNRTVTPAIRAALDTASRYLTVGARDPVVTAFVVPDSVAFPGFDGVEYRNAFWIRATESAQVADNIWAHEYVHARQAYDPDASMRWVDEGAADYFAAQVSYRARVTTYDEFHDFVATRQYANETLSDPDSWQSDDVEYVKGRRVVAALDAKIRNGTERTFLDVFRRMNDHEGVLTYDDFRSIVVDVGGDSLGPWLDDHVNGSAAPAVPVGRERYGLDPSVTAAIDTNDRGAVTLASAAGQRVTGSSTLSSGTEITVTIESDSPVSSFDRTLTTRVDDDGNWSVETNLSDVLAGAEFTVTVERGFQPLASARGRVSPPPSASINFQAQRLDGTDSQAVTISSVTLSEGGFVAVHRNDVTGDVVGSSDRRQPGTSEDVRIPLAENLTGTTTTLVAVPYLDSDDDAAFDLSTDDPYTENGAPVSDEANVTVETPTPTPTPTPAGETLTPTATPAAGTPTPTGETATAQAPTPTAEPPTGTARSTPTGSEETASENGPGFGVVSAILSVLVAVVASRMTRV